MDVVLLQIMLRLGTFILITTFILHKVSGQNYLLTSSCDGNVLSGESCTLTCDTRITQDFAVLWRFGDAPISVATSTCNSSPPFPSDYSITCPSGNSTLFTVTFTNAQYLRDTVSWRCDYVFGGRQSNTVDIVVNVPLTSVSISRSTTSITCVATSSTEPSITLYRDGRSETTGPPAVEGSAGWTATLVYSLSGDRARSIYWCQGSNSKTTVNSTASYPEIPLTSVSISRSSTSITCIATSNPRPSITLYRDGRSETTSPPAVEGSAGWRATLVYSLSGDRAKSIYWCQGSNSKTTVNSTASYPEIPLTSVSISRSSTSVTCVAISNPRPSITLYRDGRSETTSPPAVEGSAGWTATLVYSISGDRAKSIYWCGGSNSKTTVNSTASYPIGPPDVPTDVSVTPDGSSIHVTWLRGYNGGFTQTFNVEYSLDKTLWTTGGTEAETETEYYKTDISNLDPLTQYFVRVRATNKLADSPFTEVVSVTTGVKHVETSCIDNLGTGIGIGIGICVPFLFVQAVVVVFMYRRRKTTGESQRNQHADKSVVDPGPTASAVGSLYEGFDNTSRTQDYAELKLYENTKTTK